MEDESLICRVCLKTIMEGVDLRSVLDEDNNLTYLECFNLYTKLEALQDDELPKNLCDVCANDLKLILHFIQKAQESDRILKNKLKDKEVNDSTDECTEAAEDEIDIKDEEYLEEKDDMVIFEIEVYPSFDEARRNTDETEEKQDTEGVKRSTHSKEKKNREINTNSKPNYKSRNILLCNVCGKTCSQKSSLESHLLKHKGERPYQCNICHKSYFTKNGLQMHSALHDQSSQQKKFICEVCNKQFATAQRLRVHNLTHTGERDYECSMCLKRFATPFRLRNHIRIHTGERPYECKECGIKFAQSNALRCHMRIHTGEKPYECKICGKRFNQNTILKTHMTLHTGKTVECPNCDKKFSRPSYLILHQREHTGEKPYACHKCPNRYKQKSHLDRHLDTHFGIKHACPECGKEYSKKSSLKIHMFNHVEQKPFTCTDCSMSFTRRDKFRYHLRKVHNKVMETEDYTIQNEEQELQQSEHNSIERLQFEDDIVSNIVMDTENESYEVQTHTDEEQAPDDTFMTLSKSSLNSLVT